MALKSSGAPQRRRGRALEEALLDAAWAEVTERGYDEFTIEAAAARAGTSRAVLYRRWPSKPELVYAALVHTAEKDNVATPDTGTLRGDVIAVLRQANKIRARLVTLLLTRLGDFYRDTGTNLAELGAAVQGGNVLDVVIQRAIDRGEIRADQITTRIAQLPAALFRHELLMTLQPVPDSAIEEIVDTIFLPLVRANEGR